MKIISAILFFTLLSMNTHAQQSYLNKRFNFEILDLGHSILANDTGYVILNGFLDSTGVLGFHLIKTDLNLNVISIVKHGAFPYSINAGASGSLGYLDSNLFVTGSIYSNGHDSRFYLFNDNGDTIWTKSYGDSLFQSSWQTKKTRDNGYAILVNSDTYGSSGCVVLMKIDSVGNLLWEQHYPFTRADAGITLDTTFDGGFIIGGATLSYGVPVGSDCANAYCIKTDSAGNLQWYKSIGGPFYDIAWHVMQARDSNFVFAGTSVYFDPSPPTSCGDGYGISQPYVFKLRPNGDTLWTRRYGEPHFDTGLRIARELEDGSYIAAGQAYVDSTNTYLGLIIHLSSEGDSLWYRTYINLSSNYSYNILYDIQQTSDKGFIACGFVVPGGVPDTGRQDTWILQVDSNGCEVANCLLSDILDVTSTTNLNIWPNPSTGHFFVETNGERINSWMVFDQLGGLILNGIGDLQELNLEKFSNGIYYYRFIMDDKIISGKLIRD
ncbi:MAG: T9SS type A sorting domain-containing protein [Ignavibacteria bacterium]|nr:T9SS type A sorting domain-containing protein [Ignavibacteria bacterium]